MHCRIWSNSEHMLPQYERQYLACFFLNKPIIAHQHSEKKDILLSIKGDSQNNYKLEMIIFFWLRHKVGSWLTLEKHHKCHHWKEICHEKELLFLGFLVRTIKIFYHKIEINVHYLKVTYLIAFHQQEQEYIQLYLPC